MKVNLFPLFSNAELIWWDLIYVTNFIRGVSMRLLIITHVHLPRVHTFEECIKISDSCSYGKIQNIILFRKMRYSKFFVIFMNIWNLVCLVSSTENKEFTTFRTLNFTFVLVKLLIQFSFIYGIIWSMEKENLFSISSPYIRKVMDWVEL